MWLFKIFFCGQHTCAVNQQYLTHYGKQANWPQTELTASTTKCQLERMITK